MVRTSLGLWEASNGAGNSADVSGILLCSFDSLTIQTQMQELLEAATRQNEGGRTPLELAA
jgi:hypothetical protein